MKKKQPRREKFLAKMEAAVRWTGPLALIEAPYPKVTLKERKLMALKTKVRIYFF